MGTGEMSFRELPYNSDDGEDALSLSDLPLTSNSSDWEEQEYFSYIRGGRSPCSDQDLFEFSSEDFSTSFDDSLNFEDNIVFCGKLIPCRETRVPKETNNSNNSKTKEAEKKSSSRPLFTWRSDANKPRTSSSTSKKLKSSYEDGKVLAGTSKGGRVGATRKMQALSSPLKSRWYLFAFGVGRFPMTMEQSDMKTRQSKKRRGSYPTNDRREMSNSSSSGSSSILWSILNNIGCRSTSRHII